MDYTLEKISTASACDALLAGAQKKKQTLDRRRRNLGESLDKFRLRLDQLRQESAQVQSTLAAFAMAYQALTEGKDKADMNVKIKRVELRQAVLEKKTHTYNADALIVKELQYNKLDSQVSALEEYIVAVELRRKALGEVLRASRVFTLLREQVVERGVQSARIDPKHYFLQARNTAFYTRLGQG